MASGDSLLTIHAGAYLPGTTAEFDTRNNHVVLDFDAATEEIAYFTGVMPQHYGGGGVDVILHLVMSSAVANTVDLDVAFEDMSAQDIDSDGFAAVNSTDNTTVPATAGDPFTVTVTFTDGADMDSVGAGDPFRISVERDASADDAAGDMELLFVEIRES